VDPGRKRRIRLVVALSAAVLLAGTLMYTTFAGARPAEKPSQLLSAAAGRSYSLTGVVVPGTLRHSSDALAFRVRDRAGGASVPVRYAGPVPDPFREGREIVLTVRRDGGAFVGEPGSLVTKCPSKFTAKRGA
jgi:cytochrome c-type biogenesis protein CcmE